MLPVGHVGGVQADIIYCFYITLLQVKTTACRLIHTAGCALTEPPDAFAVFPVKYTVVGLFIGFPRVIGAIDFTHMCISSRLSGNEDNSVNPKSFHSH